MRFTKRDDDEKTATIIIGRGYMSRGRAIPLYCPICRENGESCRWLDVHYLSGRAEHKCDKCKYVFTLVFNYKEPAGPEIYPVKVD